MRLLYLLTRELGRTGECLRQEQGREHEVEVIDLRREPDWQRVVAAIEAADRVLTW